MDGDAAIGKAAEAAAVHHFMMIVNHSGDEAAHAMRGAIEDETVYPIERWTVAIET